MIANRRRKERRRQNHFMYMLQHLYATVTNTKHTKKANNNRTFIFDERPNYILKYSEEKKVILAFFDVCSLKITILTLLTSIFLTQDVSSFMMTASVYQNVITHLSTHLECSHSHFFSSSMHARQFSIEKMLYECERDGKINYH
jgi:hypothetical protein